MSNYFGIYGFGSAPFCCTANLRRTYHQHDMLIGIRPKNS